MPESILRNLRSAQVRKLRTVQLVDGTSRTETYAAPGHSHGEYLQELINNYNSADGSSTTTVPKAEVEGFKSFLEHRIPGIIVTYDIARQILTIRS